ncbi:phosphomannomutase, partial [Streptococcus sp. SPC0]|nr:phosphomannomutase [Streptococcus sp. SPC0]
KYYFNEGSWYALRPSGTEPKIKCYLYTIGCTEADSLSKLNAIESACRAKMNSTK